MKAKDTCGFQSILWVPAVPRWGDPLDPKIVGAHLPLSSATDGNESKTNQGQWDLHMQL